MAAPLPACFCPGQLAVLFATSQCLPLSPNLQFPCFVAPEIKKAITASNKGSTLQQWGLLVASQALLPLQPSLCSPIPARLGLWGLVCLCVATQTSNSGAERATGSGQELPHAEVWHAAGVLLARLRTDAASELFYLWFLLHLTHTSRVFLLLFIHREIVHP